MSEVEKKIMETFEKVVPGMTEIQREKLLSFGEGVAFAISRQQQTDSAAASVSQPAAE